ncbi:MAG TPA: DUF2147 domain-containing protein [Chitinophagaceae bacterium]|nr:DUF2147 domain-containing protein [Chitinophagaceae bacterium]
MKPLLILLTVLFSLPCYCQNADAIVGKWLKTPKEDLIIQVYKAGNEYKGKIAWAKDNDKTKPAGFIILEELKYNPNKKMWKDGKIHDPNSGNTYDAEAKIKSDGTLEVLGYLGMRFLGKKKYFKRVK